MRIEKQNEINECGLLVIQALHKFYFAKKLSLNYLNSLTSLSAVGLSLSQMVELGGTCGIKLTFYEMEKDEFSEYKILNPIIALVKEPITNLQHFVIIYKKTTKYIYYCDSQTGDNHKAIYDDSFYRSLSFIFASTHKDNYNFKSKNISNSVIDFMKSESHNLILLFLINSTFIFLTIISSLFSKVLVDYLFVNKIFIDILIVILFFIIINFFKILIDFIQNNILKKVLLNFSYSLSEQVLLNINQKPYKFYYHYNKTSVIQKTQLIQSVSNFIVIKITKLFYNIFILVTILTLLLFLFNQVAILLFGLILLLILINYYFNLINKPWQIKQLEFAQIELGNRLKLIEQMANLKTANKAVYFKKIWKSSYLKLQNYHFNIFNNVNAQTLFNSSLRIIINFGLIAIIILFAFQAHAHLSFIIMMMSILTLIWGPTFFISNFISDFSEDKNNFYNLLKILNYQNEKISEVGIEFNIIKDVKLTNLNFRYHNQIIFTDFNLNITNNSVITGANGSGKSTLLRLLATYEISENILLNNQKFSLINITAYRKNIILFTNEESFIEELITNLKINSKNKFWINLFDKYHFWLIFKKLNIQIEQITITNYQFLSLGQKQVLNFLILFKQKYLLILIDELLSNVNHKICKILFRILTDYQTTALIIAISHNYINFPQSYKLINIGDHNNV